MTIANKIVFIHVPKSGGTSLVEMFKEVFKEQSKARILYGHRTDLSGDVSFVGGHLEFREVEAHLDDIFSFTFVRRPADRLLSTYRFWKSHKDAYIDSKPEELFTCRLARDLKFEDFIRDERTLELIDNKLVRTFTNLEVGNQRIKREHFENALDNLRRLNFVGFYENFEASCNALFALLHLDIPEIRHENNLDARLLAGDAVLEWSPRIDRHELDLASREVFDSLNLFDELLYSCLLDGKN